MLITVTPVKGADLSKIKKGQKIEFKKDSEGMLSQYQVNAYFNGNEVGVVAETPKTLAPKTVSVKEIYDKLPNQFTGVVEDHRQQMTGSASRTSLVVSIGTKKAKETPEETIFTLKVKGANSVYPEKATVIKDFSDGNKVVLPIKLKDDKIIAYRDGKLAGVVDEKQITGASTLEEIKQLKEILSTGVDLEGEISNVKGLSYFINVSVSSSVLEEAKVTVSKSAIGNIKKELIDKGFDEETLSTIENYLLDNKFDADYIIEIFKTYKSYPEEVKSRIPKRPERVFKDNEENLLLTAFSAISNKYNILCSGEKGTGKNVFIETIAWIYQRPLYGISINRETDKYDLIGSKTIDAEIESESGTAVNKIKFSKEVLIEAMEVGGIINIDEINFADPGITGLLHSIGDDRRAIEVPGYKYVTADNNFAIMATMNLDYQGTQELNEALADRFVDITFANNDSIYDILKDACIGVKKSDLSKADKVYQEMVSRIRNMDEGIGSECITIRGFIQGVNMSKVIGLKKALIITVAGKIRDEEYRNNVKDIIENFIV